MADALCYIATVSVFTILVFPLLFPILVFSLFFPFLVFSPNFPLVLGSGCVADTLC